MRKLPHVFHLPLSVDPLIAEALDAAIVSNTSTQEAARHRLNEGLVAAGLKPVSHTAWHRFLHQQLREGVHARWRRGTKAEVEAAAQGETVTVPKAAYLALLDAVERLIPEED